ncbi:MAG: Holliday junction resolvase RuvX [Pontimonas sp.]|nr:MAG: Holliday junction resolvase [actinobacterium acMicro-4]MCF8522450.1 Holliday junction resolvase RuvX [Pontimonas sp.]MCF8547326.1 Holliday junction resolvase RuvX [Pontimonas sp.]
MREGIRLGIDVGQARVGVARSDPQATMAVPVATVARATALLKISGLLEEYQPLEVVVGLPINLQGERTASTEDAEAFAREIAALGPVPVRMVDERLSTVSAISALHSAGRSSRSHRLVVDQVAAVILLQHTLDVERSQGVPGGYVLGHPETHDE